MKVKLCTRCPYTASDLDDHYDSEALVHACARCDGEKDKAKPYYPLEPHRRRKCSIVPKPFETPRRSAVPCAVGNSVLSGIIPGDRPSARRNASNASGFAENITTDGCEPFTPAEPLAALFSCTRPHKTEPAN